MKIMIKNIFFLSGKEAEGAGTGTGTGDGVEENGAWKEGKGGDEGKVGVERNGAEGKEGWDVNGGAWLLWKEGGEGTGWKGGGGGSKKPDMTFDKGKEKEDVWEEGGGRGGVVAGREKTTFGRLSSLLCWSGGGRGLGKRRLVKRLKGRLDEGCWLPLEDEGLYNV